MRPLIAGNWKMNGLRESAVALARNLAARMDGAPAASWDMLLCPPSPLIVPVIDALADARILVGGQDCHPERSGAHTGDVSANMLADLRCTYVIVGHSERRIEHKEDDALVGAKAATALALGLIPIICVGETLAERDGGRAAEVVLTQLRGSLPEDARGLNTVIAYEPVWAIGTGRTAGVADIADMHGRIRDELDRLGRDAGEIRLLYGGSVKPDNASEILAVSNVDGALVGGASLDAEQFWAICRALPAG